MEHSMGAVQDGFRGTVQPTMAPHGNYPCLGYDRWIGITVTGDSQWEALCRALGCVELLEDSRFSDAMARWKNQDALDRALAAKTRDHDADELTAKLQEAGVPAGPTLAVDQLWTNTHLRERGFFQSYETEDGTIRDIPGVPWRFDGAADANMTPPPLRGQHNAYVFEDLLGLSKPEIEALVEEQVIY